jgi:hypothetical protein
MPFRSTLAQAKGEKRKTTFPNRLVDSDQNDLPIKRNVNQNGRQGRAAGQSASRISKQMAANVDNEHFHFRLQLIRFRGITNVKRGGARFRLQCGAMATKMKSDDARDSRQWNR